MKSSLKMLVFNLEIDSGKNLFGFKVCSAKNVIKYLKAIKLLENNNSNFQTDAGSYEYSSQDFEVMTVSNSELKVLSKFFDLDNSDTDSNVIGFFPDILDDAYNDGLIEEEPEDDDFDMDDEESEY